MVPPGGQHAGHLTKSTYAVTEVHQSEGAHHLVEGAFRKGQGFGGACSPLHRGCETLGDGEHALPRVEADDGATRSHSFRCGAGEHSSAARDVEEAIPPARPAPGRSSRSRTARRGRERRVLRRLRRLRSVRPAWARSWSLSSRSGASPTAPCEGLRCRHPSTAMAGTGIIRPRPRALETPDARAADPTPDRGAGPRP